MHNVAGEEAQPSRDSMHSTCLHTITMPTGSASWCRCLLLHGCLLCPSGREVAGGSHRYADVEALFQRLSERLDAAAVSAEGQQAGSDRTPFQLYGDAGELDAGNRSPTYRAQVVQRGRWQVRQHRFDILDQLLDCQAMLHRPNQGGSAELDVGGGEAGRSVRQGDGARNREQRWQHDLFSRESNGADSVSRNLAPEGSRSLQDGSKKRHRW